MKNNQINQTSRSVGSKKFRASLLWWPLFSVLTFVNAIALVLWEVGVSIRYLDPKISAIVSAVIGLILLAVFFMKLKKSKITAENAADMEETEKDDPQN